MDSAEKQELSFSYGSLYSNICINMYASRLVQEDRFGEKAPLHLSIPATTSIEFIDSIRLAIMTCCSCP